jgi:hypothetical protein
MYKSFCCFAEDFREQLRVLQDPLGMKSAAKIVQFPYLVAVYILSLCFERDSEIPLARD